MSTAKTIYVIDVEATCWETEPPNTFKWPRNEIIEIGITPIDIQTKKIGDSSSIIVLPTSTEISPFCTKLTSLTPEFVQEHGIPFRKACGKLTDEYKTHRNVFASWGDYDRKIFDRQCSNEHVPYPFANLHLNIKSLFSARYGFNGGVGKICQFLGLKFEGTAHRGIYDSRMTAKILLHLLSPT